MDKLNVHQYIIQFHNFVLLAKFPKI